MAYETIAGWAHPGASATTCPTPFGLPSDERGDSWRAWMTGFSPGLLIVLDPESIYRPRHPQATPLYELMESLYESVKGQWEERFETRYGYWRGLADEAVARYLDCGVLERGFARARCGACKAEFLIAFSCKGRGLCPSCAAKRAAAFAAFLHEEVLEPVGHAQWVFTIPKMLRPYFLYHRELLGGLCRAAYETVRELMVAACDDAGVRPGFVAVVQTFGDKLNWNPHVHALASRGGWDSEDRWVPLPYLASDAAELLFRHKVLKLLSGAGYLDEERVALLMSWRHHTGFSVHNAVTVAPDDGPALERLGRYLLRAPVSLERLRQDEVSGEVRYAPKTGHDQPGADSTEEGGERFDAREFVARVILQIPDPKRHLTRYYGRYASVVRARRRRKGDSPTGQTPAGSDSEKGSPTGSACGAELRRRWANLIRRIYETDPLTCSRCGEAMRIIAFITERPVILKILRHLGKLSATPRGPP